MKVYVVKFDWTFDDNADVDITIYSTYEKAYKAYKQIIADEKNPDLSWVGSMAFDEKGKLEHNYEIEEIKRKANEETEVYWCINCKNDYVYQHSFVSLHVMEVK